MGTCLELPFHLPRAGIALHQLKGDGIKHGFVLREEEIIPPILRGAEGCALLIKIKQREFGADTFHGDSAPMPLAVPREGPFVLLCDFLKAIRHRLDGPVGGIGPLVVECHRNLVVVHAVHSRIRVEHDLLDHGTSGALLLSEQPHADILGA